MGGEESKPAAEPAAPEPSPPTPPAAPPVDPISLQVRDEATKNKSDFDKLREDSDFIKSGRYRPASPETIEALRLTQNQTGIKPMFTGTPKEQRAQAQKMIREQEGLEIGLHERRHLAQQWRFYLASEPIQRGFDGGLVGGSIAAAVMAFNPANRKQPMRLIVYWGFGFCAGMMTVPLLLMVSETMNQARNKRHENELLEKQRRAFAAAEKNQR